MNRLLTYFNFFCYFVLTFAITSCATGSKVYPPYKNEAGSLRLVQVMQLASRQEIVNLGVHYKYLLASGLQDSDLQDKRLGAGRVYCCGGPAEEGMGIWFYIPPGLEVAPGDIVEIKMGREPSGNDSGMINTATRVRQRKEASNPQCRWVPDNENLWMRVLYCDWMEAEGWIEKKGFESTWLKPAP